jgi:hypothetical protein
MAYGFGTRSSAGGIVLLYNYYFPGRVIFIDGDRSEVLKDNPLGAMAFRVPAGEHRVDIRWERTPVQRVGETVSLVALAGFIFFWWWSRRNNGKDMILWNASKSGT